MPRGREAEQMSRPLRVSIGRFFVAWLAVFCVTSSVAGQSGGGQAPRAWDGHPDLNGIWQALGTANWDLEDHPARPGHPDLGAIGATPPGQGVVVGGTIPYQASALDQKRKNFENRMAADPEAKCFMPGVPRATYHAPPFPNRSRRSKNHDGLRVRGSEPDDPHGQGEAGASTHRLVDGPLPRPLGG